MRKSLIFRIIVLIIIMSSLIFGVKSSRGEQFGSKLVERQRQKDKTNIQEIKDRYSEFIDGMNKILGLKGVDKLHEPIGPDAIEDIKKIDDIHSDRDVTKQTAYINGERVKMRSANTTHSEQIGTLDFGEKVELLVQSDFKESINGSEASWYLIRRSGGDEGWVFGRYVQRDKPVRNDERTITGGEDDFALPTTGKVSSKFGYRVHPVTKKSYTFHSGIDIAAPRGTPVKASADGIVKKSGYFQNGYGNLIVIQHRKDMVTYYGHLDKRGAEAGDSVKKGQEIGTVGRTGRATGPHLHFEVRRGKKALDPDEFLR